MCTRMGTSKQLRIDFFVYNIIPKSYSTETGLWNILRKFRSFEVLERTIENNRLISQKLAETCQKSTATREVILRRSAKETIYGC